MTLPRIEQNGFHTSIYIVPRRLRLYETYRLFLPLALSLRWNQLDLAIVLLSVMGITLEEIDLNASLPINPTIIRIMRVLRIARGTRALTRPDCIR